MKKYYPWFVSFMLCFVAFLNYLDRQMLSTMRPSMKLDIVELQSATSFGYLMAIFLWIYAFMSPVSGIIADRLNRKWLIVGSLFVWSGVTLLMGYATTYNEVYVLRAIMGISEAFYIPAGLALIADYHEGKTRSLAIGIHTTGVYLGQAAGGFGATVASTFSWQTAFHVFGIVGMTYSFVLIAFLREKKIHSIPATATAITPAKTTMGGEFSAIGKGFAVLFGNLAFWVLLFYFTAPSAPGWAIKNWLPTLLSETLGLDMSRAGPIATITTAMASFCGVLLGGFLSDRWVQKNLKGRIYTGVIGLFLTLPALVLVGYGGSIALILAGAVLFGLGFGMFDVNNMPILCQFVPARYRATGYGIMNCFGISLGAVITSLLGKSADAGNMGRDFALLGGLVIVTIILQLTVLRPTCINKTEATA